MQYVETIQKEDGRSIIKLYGHVSTYIFYNSFMRELYHYTHKTGKNSGPLTISIKNVDWIDSNVLPCLISVGIILKRYYRVPTKLEMLYNPSLLQYLYISKFFYWTGKDKLDIFDFDEELIGGFGLYVKEYNRDYKIEKFQSMQGYYELDEYKQKEEKYRLLEQLEQYDIRRIFGEVISRVISKDTTEYDRCIQAIAEIVCNSILYSESDAYACVQALPKGVHISICDIGIGFAKSLRKKGLDIETDKTKAIINEFKGINVQNKQSTILDDFFAIFAALQYAEDTDRINLWKLKKIVTDNKGTMRIHSNRIQVVFSHNRCFGCIHQSASACVKCMIDNFSTNYKVSPLRIYNAKIEGVHIEIDFAREEG